LTEYVNRPFTSFTLVHIIQVVDYHIAALLPTHTIQVKFFTCEHLIDLVPVAEEVSCDMFSCEVLMEYSILIPGTE
jgi:hypothetical protein